MDDAISEAEEGFTVVLSNPEGASLEDDTGEGTITDDDEAGAGDRRRAGSG